MKAIIISKTMNYFIVLENLGEIDSLTKGQSLECHLFSYNFFNIENTKILKLMVITEENFKKILFTKKPKEKKRIYALIQDDNKANTVSIYLSDKWFKKNVKELSGQEDILLDYNDKFNRIIFTKNPLTINMIMDSTSFWPVKTY